MVTSEQSAREGFVHRRRSMKAADDFARGRAVFAARERTGHGPAIWIFADPEFPFTKLAPSA